MHPVGLIGYPIQHSVSPAIHNAAFEALGLPYQYTLWPTTADALPQRLAQLRRPGMLGANVTMPHKEAVVPLLDRVEGLASPLATVNTIIRQHDELIGLNTDLPAFLAELEAADYHPQKGPALVLGAGGAARTVAWALLEKGAPSVTIANRRLERAEELLADLLALRDDDPKLVALDSADEAGLRAALDEGVTLLVNATSAGWGDELPIAPELLHRDLLVYDLIYRRTPLLEAATRAGAQTLDGLGMLVRQAALAFERWTAQPAPLRIMWQAAEAARGDRHSVQS